MSQSGPSHEELENYYKNSRPYFDELAKHYYETDRAYYNKYIAPFYGPFSGIVPGKNAAASKISVLVAAILVAVIGAAVAFFLAVETDNPKEQKQIEDVKDKSKKNTDENGKSRDTDSNKRKKLSDYERGIEYYNLEDYSGAERYFRRVPKSDENYDDAQEKLEEIKEIRKTIKDNRYVKPSPIERKR
jgi:tetratricopeptide (TPR) repeat protein